MGWLGKLTILGNPHIFILILIYHKQNSTIHVGIMGMEWYSLPTDLTKL